MKAQQSAYLAYLIRLWQARGVNGVNWRASLEDAQTHERFGFEDLMAMAAFLKEVTQRSEPKT